MNINKQKILFSDNKTGQYTLAQGIVAENELLDWIRDGEFNKYTNEKYRLHRHTRKRNKLYSFRHPILNKEVILKISQIDKSYKLYRRLNLHASTLFNDYNFRAFSGANQLKQHNISCAKPIAYWNEKGMFLTEKSFYLYEKVQAEHSVHSFIENIKTENLPNLDELVTCLAIRISSIVRQIHQAGLRQGDPHPGNFLIDMPKCLPENNAISVSEISAATLSIIDLDKFETSNTLSKKLKLFYDIRCLRRCTVGRYDQYEMLKFYMQNEYSSIWKSVLWFWMHGGFNPSKWFKPAKKRR